MISLSLITIKIIPKRCFAHSEDITAFSSTTFNVVQEIKLLSTYTESKLYIKTKQKYINNNK